MSIRTIIAELSVSDTHWNIESLVRAATALEWIVSQPTNPNDPRAPANWWDLYRAAQWGLGLIHNPPAATGGPHAPDPLATDAPDVAILRDGDDIYPGRYRPACLVCED